MNQEVVHDTTVEIDESEEDVTTAEILDEKISPVGSENGTNIISDYLKEQMSKSAKSGIDTVIDNAVESNINE